MLPIQSVLVACVLMTCCAAEDPLNEALNNSDGINIDDLYNETLIHLDMENRSNVSSKLTSDFGLTVFSSGENCSSIMQVDGIPWNNNNSAMRINDSDSYVEVNKTGVFNGGLSVSLWIKNSESSDQECTVLTVDVEGNPNLQLKRKSDGHSYSLHGGHGNYVNFSFQDEWEWNMLSFTLNSSTGHVTTYENGAAKDNHSHQFNFTAVENDVKIRLNGVSDTSSAEGCGELELDEVALWRRVLNMTEFIALRVQPFDTNCTVNVTVLLTRIKMGTPEEASASVTELRIVINNEGTDDWAEDDFIGEVNNALDAMVDMNLLSHPNLSSETNKGNREAFIEITSAILIAATEDPEIKNYVKGKNVIQRLDDVMKGVYFAEDFPAINETIITPLITTKLFHLDPQQDDEGLTIVEDSATFTIPKKVLGEENSRVIVTVFDQSLNTFVESDLENASIADRMVSLQVYGTEGPLEERIELIFPDAGKNNAEKLKNYTANCSYLDLEENKFKTNGVETKEYKPGDNDIVCYIYHLTNFAVLLSPNDLEPDDTLAALTYVLLAISIICLTITLVVLMCLREIANTQRVQILKHFIFALLVSQLLFVFTTDLVKNKTLCMIFAAILHYFWLATFTWMLVQGIQLYTKVRRLVGGNIKQLFYVLFAWGFPLPIAAIPLAAFSSLYYERAKTICWIPSDLIWFFAVPVVLIFCVNLGVTVLVMKTFLTVKVNKDKSDAEKLKSSMRAVVVMVPVLGLTWAFGFLLLVDQSKIFQYLFVILNTTQGVFVFLFHLVMNEDVKSAVLRRRNKVAANAENTIFTKLPRNKSEHSGGTGTETSKAPLHSDSTTGM